MIVVFVLSFLCCVCASPPKSFVFITPPASFVHHNIALGLHLQSRGHAVTFLTLEGFRKHFDRQAATSIRGHHLPPVTIHEVAPYVKDRFNMLASSTQKGHPTNPYARVVKLAGAIRLYEHYFMDIFSGLPSLLGSRNISDVFGSKSLFIIPGPWPTPLKFVRDNQLPHVVTSTHVQYSNYFFDQLLLDQSSLELTDESYGIAPRSFLQRLHLVHFSFQMMWNSGQTPVDTAEFASVRGLGTLRLIDGIPQMTTKKAFGPLTVYTGPIVSDAYMSRKNLLPEETDFLDNGGGGVVYMSLGSNAVLSSAQVQLLFDATVGHSWKLMWAVPDDQINLLTNIQPKKLRSIGGRALIIPWSHTPAVLAHDNVRLFISHCGANGFGEALTTGTPIVGLPLFGDQPQNCIAGRNLGVARCFDIHSLSSEELRAAIADIIEGEEEHPMTIAAAKMKSFTTTAYRGANTAADWLEVAYDNGGDFRFMQTPIEIEGFAKGYCLDIITGIVFIITMLTQWVTLKAAALLSMYEIHMKRV